MKDETPDPLDQKARELMNIPYLFPWQKLVISSILEYCIPSENEEQPRNQIILLPTGAGKSLCFTLPALMMKGVTVVIFPLLALMSDQLRRCHQDGINAEVLKGGMSHEERKNIYAKLKEGKIPLLFTNPEMIQQEECRKQLSEVTVSHFVIDEAHTVSEWGESFRPAFLSLREAIKTLKPPLISAFTATASLPILSSLKNILFGDEEVHLAAANPDRVNISYRVEPVYSLGEACSRLVCTMARPMIIFCASRIETELAAQDILNFLRMEEVRFYHAGLSREEKKVVENWFHSSEDGVLVATCAYGMGVDKKNIRSVVHRTPPPSVEAYLQESGRAGRDGKEAEAVLLYSPEAVIRLERIEDPLSRQRYSQLLEYARNPFRCRRESLLILLNAHPDDCTRCDVCRHEVHKRPFYEKEWLTIIRRAGGLLTLAELPAGIKGWRGMAWDKWGSDLVHLTRPFSFWPGEWIEEYGWNLVRSDRCYCLGKKKTGSPLRATGFLFKRINQLFYKLGLKKGQINFGIQREP